MNNKNIIIAGAIAVGLYFFSQMKKTAQRIRPTATPAVRQRTAQKVAQKIAQKVAQKVAPKRIGQPTTEAARIAALLRATAQKENIFELPIQLLRYLISHAAAQKKTGKEVAALRAEVVRREAAYNAATRKAAAQKIGKKIGKKVAQKIPINVKTRRAVIAQYAKRQRPRIQRPRPNKKQIASRLFPGAEKSRIIPYSESSKHSYYGSKSHKLQNEGYGKGKAERDRKQALEFRLNELRDMFPESEL